MRKYLLTVVIRPESKFEEITSLLKELVQDLGKVSKGEELPHKKLSYPVGGLSEASFWQVELEIPGDTVSKINEALRVSDQVLRFAINSVSLEGAKKV